MTSPQFGENDIVRFRDTAENARLGRVGEEAYILDAKAKGGTHLYEVYGQIEHRGRARGSA